MIILGVVLSLIAVLVVVISYFSYRNWKTQHSQNQAIFLAGKVPATLDGFYKGTVTGFKTDWQGKKLDASHSSGINVFHKDGQDIENFPFKTYTGQGLQDKNLEVFKIDYDNSTNPWWVRRVVDELVETGPGQYLGKIHLKILPGLSFAVGYFRLSK